jgi:hypothetical protein
MTVFQANWAHSFEFEYTSQSTDLTAFFHEEMTSYISILNNGYNIPFYFSLYDTIFNDTDTEYPSNGFNATLGSFIRLNKHFLISLNASLSLQDNLEPIERARNYLLGGGLVIQGMIGTIGLFADYHHYSYYYDGEYDDYGKDIIDPVDYAGEKAVYSLIPIINTSNFPILGYVVNKIAGHINNNQNNETNYSIRLVSQPLSFGSVTITSFAPYYSSRQFSLRAKNNLYGLLTNFNIDNRFVFFVDIGYKDYFDIITENSFYEDTFYFRSGFPIKSSWGAEDMWHGLSFYIDKQHPFPRIGYIYQIRNSRAILEIGFYKTFYVQIACRINWADREYARSIYNKND